MSIRWWFVVDFEKGEIRTVGIEVVSRVGNQFVIDTAECTVSLEGEVLDKSICTIDGHKILTLFHAEQEGRHKLIFSYTIAEERLIDIVTIEVI